MFQIYNYSVKYFMKKELMVIYFVFIYVFFICEDMKWIFVFVVLFFYCVLVIFFEGKMYRMIFIGLSKFCCDS